MASADRSTSCNGGTTPLTQAIAERVEVQGHRGFGNSAPHNTLKAFRSAAQHPCLRSVEFDVRRSRDGVLVVTHGPEISSALSNTETALFEEIRSVDAGDGEFVPTLEEVVSVCLEGGLIMNVEVKAPPKALVDAALDAVGASRAGGDEPGANHLAVVDETLALLRRMEALQSCRISSFSREVLERVKQLDAGIPIGALYHAALRPNDEKDPSLGDFREPAPEDFATWLRSGPNESLVPGDSVNLCAECVTAELVAAAKAAEVKVMVWFPSRAAKAFEETSEMLDRHIELGVDVVCTNNPHLWERR
eukprot:TRINITY_DN4337_c0_g1_i2.p1 TRINITY_DN4337_c0_g1~~TRINITY_DN4337_c0_g1_i2.p1  ORF type:complete len:306 (+),score=62.92 TRINITY_DN4337_c0_g1_i2:53-970(+)